MSIRGSIIESIQRSRDLLDEYFGPLHDFLWDQHAPEGGFRGPDGQTSLYHTALALETLRALGVEPPIAASGRYLARFASGHGLSLLELTSLIRAWRALGHDVQGWAARLERFRATDGGFAHIPGRQQAQVDATFLAACAIELEDDFSGLHNCRQDDAYCNSPDEPWPGTVSTAMALIILHENNPDAVDWLLQRQAPKGGFLATQSSQVPDLLSTGIALHALAKSSRISPDMREKNMDFMDSLWQNRGGFQQSWANPEVSIETIYYGLLALGHLG